MELAPGTKIKVRTPVPSFTPVYHPKGEKGDTGAAGGSDAATADHVSNGALTKAALSATIAAEAVPKWKPNTAYAAGARVVNPSGDIVLAKTAFTSGATYDPNNWNLPSTYITPATAEATYARIEQGAALSRLNLAKPQNVLTWLTTFQSGHGYTVDGAGLQTSSPNDTTDPAVGTQSMLATSKGTGGGINIHKETGIVLDMTGKDPVLWVQVSDVDKYNWVSLILASDSGYANNYTWTIFQDDPRPPYLVAGRWMMVTLPWALATVTGAPNRAAITAVKITCGDMSTGAMTFNFGGIGYIPSPARFPNGAVVLTFDDSYAGAWNIAWKKMSPLNLRGTLFPTVDSIGTSNALTLTQIKTMYQRGGWEVGAHVYLAADHPTGVTSMTQAQRTAKFAELKKWLYDQGFEADSYAYPSGLYDTASMDDVLRYFTSGRSIYARYETYPVPSRAALKSKTLGNTDTLVSLQAIIDKVKANRNVQVFTVHDIVTSATTGLQVSQSVFEGLIDYIVAQGVAVVTQRELMQAA